MNPLPFLLLILPRAYSFTVDDFLAVIFLVGLALSNAPNPPVALAGCLLSSMVVLGAVVSLVGHVLKCKKLRKDAKRHPLRVPQPTKAEKEQSKPRVGARSSRIFRTALDGERNILYGTTDAC